MITLGIETSCDETAVAVTQNNRILSNSVSSSVHLHKAFGGVIPEIACRYHVEYINYVFRDALKKAKLKLDSIELVAVTVRPGLVGALLVGISMAKALCLAKNIPLVGVDHLIAHLYAVFLEGRKVAFPFIGMVVSGGHTNLFLVKSVTEYTLIGQTLDDAAGEAFDKVAKLLGLEYPGGPAIENRALNKKGDRRLFLRGNLDRSMNFSFSGIKTAVLYHLRDRLNKEGLLQRTQSKASAISPHVQRLKQEDINMIAASFQEAVTTTLTEKAIAACRHNNVRRLVLGGGVSANTQLRNKLLRRAYENGIRLFLPSKRLCLDNAAMIGGLGEALYKKGVRSDLTITASSIGTY